MKKLWFTLLTVLAMTFVTAGCALSQPASTNEQSHALNVTGTGTVYVQPDVARINIGVQTQSPDAGEALAENTTKRQASTNPSTIMPLKGLKTKRSSLSKIPFPLSSGNLTP